MSAIDLSVNRVYWEYTQNNSFMRPDKYNFEAKIPSLFVRTTVDKYITSRNSIKTDLVALSKAFAQEHSDESFVLALSGGIDSEVTAETFYQLGIPFKALILRLFNGINDHDIMYAVKYCRNRGIQYSIVSLGIDKFIEEVIPKAMCLGQFVNSYSQMALTHLFDYTDDILIFSGHNPDFNKQLGFGWLEDSPNMVKYAIKTDKKFFTFTSLEPLFCHYARSLDLTQPGDKDNTFLYEDYPELEVREKQTGWEYSYNYSHKIQEAIKELRTVPGQSFITWESNTLRHIRNVFSKGTRL